MVISIKFQLVHAESWLLFKEHIGACICIDEVALSWELYTVLTNKKLTVVKCSMIAIIKRYVDVHAVTSVLLKLSIAVTKCEITLDMALTWSQIARSAFLRPSVLPIAFITELAYEAVQEMRVKSSLGGFG